MSTDDDLTAQERAQDEERDKDVQYLEQVTSATNVPIQELMGYASAARAIGTSYQHTIESFLQADPHGRLHDMLADRERFARAAAVIVQRKREEVEAEHAKAQQEAQQPSAAAPEPDPDTVTEK